jgi:hypothetical protein
VSYLENLLQASEDDWISEFSNRKIQEYLFHDKPRDSGLSGIKYKSTQEKILANK